MKMLIAKGVGWVGASRALVNVLGFASTLLLARLLVPADFGLVAIATTVAAIAASMTELSLSLALIHHAEPERSHYDTAWTLNAGRALVLSAVTAALAWPLAHVYGDPRLIAVLLATAAVGALSGFSNPKLVVFTRRMAFHQDFVLSVASKLAGFIAAVGIAYVYRSYWALIAGAAAGEALKLVLSYVLLPYRPRLDLSRTRELLSFSLWLSLTWIVGTLNYRFDNLLIGYFLGSTAVGLYSVGDNLASLPTREAITPVGQTLFPAFTQFRDDKARLRSAYQRAQALLTMIALPIGCGFALVAEPTILLTIGEKWRPAVPIVQLLAAVFALQTLGSLLHPLALAMGETRVMLRRETLNFALRIPLVAGGLALGGLVGVAEARVVSGLIWTLLSMGLVRRLLDLPLREQFRVNIRALAAAAAMAIVLWPFQRLMGPAIATAITQPIALALTVALGALVYFTSLALMWLAAGRPEGPETEGAVLFKTLISRFTARQI